MSTIKATYDPARGLIQEYGEPTFTFLTGSTVTFDAPISYTPSDPDNWRPVPSDLLQAVDYLADTAHTTTLVFDISGSAGGNGSTITAGGTAVAISATNYATAPAWALDAGSNGVKLNCTGAAASSSQWTANVTITAVGIGA